MKLLAPPAGQSDEFLYGGTIPASGDYTARAVPRYGVAVPLEDAHIAWQR